MSATDLTVTELAPMMRQLYGAAVRDKTYRGTPVGQQAHRYLRSLRFDGATTNTLDAYEHVLARLALDHADFGELADFCTPVGTEYLREFLDRHWGDASQATKRQRTSILKSFMAWAAASAIIPWNPAEPIRTPRGRSLERLAYPQHTIEQLIASQPSLRDQCCLELMAYMALRRRELQHCQVKDIDLARNLLTVHGKGNKTAILPLEFTQLRNDLTLHLLERHPDEYLLYPKSSRHQPMSHGGVHNWFKRCLDIAGLPATMKMHELRHTAADNLWRATGNIVLAQQLLRHESSGTTQAYLHPTREDLAAGIRALEATWQPSSS